MPRYPFSATFGQASFKLALILAAINPAMGGVLISGPRGLAKSTLARGLADVMPQIDGHVPSFMTLPLGASEEMLVGTLDLQQVLDRQQLVLKPGLLAKADQGVLYVDEVNLLPDNLVDLLLDVSASGVNVVERDGISQQHSAQFILLGTMNPDEGELRPQLLDRFGLSVSLSHHLSIEDRVEIVKRRDAFDRDPNAFIAGFQAQQDQLRQSITKARSGLETVTLVDELRTVIAQRCQEANVEGVRADIVWSKAASAHCAWSNRHTVTTDDIDAVEDLVLGHRRKPVAPTPPQPPAPYSRPPALPEQNDTTKSAGDWGEMLPVEQTSCEHTRRQLKDSMEATVSGERMARMKQTFGSISGKLKGTGGVGVKTTSNQPIQPRQRQRVNWFATFAHHIGRWPIQRFRFHKPKSAQPVLNLVLLDTSASVLKNRLFAKAKSVVLSIADQAYLQRENMAVLGFGNQTVQTLLPERRAPKALQSLLDGVTASGGTPLRDMLLQARTYQKKQLQRSPGLKICTYLISDGKTTQPYQDLHLLGDVMVIDMEESSVKRGKMRAIADVLKANYIAFPQLIGAQV